MGSRHASIADKGGGRGDVGPDNTVVISTLQLMPVVFESEDMILLDHSRNLRDEIEGVSTSTSWCPMEYRLTVLSKKDGGQLVCNIRRPPRLEGTSQPDFSRDFVLYSEFNPTMCCTSFVCHPSPSRLRASTAPSVSPLQLRFRYTKDDCAKFREYPGRDLSLVKYGGRVIVVSDRFISEATSEIALEVSGCMGLSSIEDMFQRDRDYSKHVVHITYCKPEVEDEYCCSSSVDGSVGNRMPYYGMRVGGPFVVYKYCTLSPACMWMSEDRLAGRLIVERMAAYDSQCPVIGGKDVSVVTPTFLTNGDAERIWRAGCPIRLVNVRERGSNVVIQRASASTPSPCTSP